MGEHISLALAQVARISQLADFLEHRELRAAIKRSAPVGIPPGPGSMGFDEPLWVGLGIVGLWAALDAFAERANLKAKCLVCGRSACVVGRLASNKPAPSTTPLEEIEDLRHLFAHSCGGHADTTFLTFGTRHVLTRPGTVLSCGVVFDGHSLSLTGQHLRHYAECARITIEAAL
jgi:hypothetical protein